MTTHPVFEVVTTTTGALSIKNKIVNEIMHNPVGPWVEANNLYIDQSRLSQRLNESSSDEFVIFDVGLGAASNALAALHCHSQQNNQQSSRPLKIISFEKDLELLRFALSQAKQFDHFRNYTKSVEELLEKHLWKTLNVQWELRHGDFLDLIESEKNFAHLIFYDPYSPQVNSEMWTLNCFKKLRKKCRDHSCGGTELYTYSRSTQIRVALLAADFFVGKGRPIGLKTETTAASSCLGQLQSPLDGQWLKRWKNSHRPYPFNTLEKDFALIKSQILQHPQFESSKI